MPIMQRNRILKVCPNQKDSNVCVVDETIHVCVSPSRCRGGSDPASSGDPYACSKNAKVPEVSAVGAGGRQPPLTLFIQRSAGEIEGRLAPRRRATWCARPSIAWSPNKIFNPIFWSLHVRNYLPIFYGIASNFEKTQKIIAKILIFRSITLWSELN